MQNKNTNNEHDLKKITYLEDSIMNEQKINTKNTNKINKSFLDQKLEFNDRNFLNNKKNHNRKLWFYVSVTIFSVISMMLLIFWSVSN